MVAPLDSVHLPRRRVAPLAAITRRVLAAIALVVFVASVVTAGRDGYVDVTGDEISFLDALYYASVTVTTTGYGDITAVSDGARLATILLITPARILFLILVVSTTVEVLTEQTRVMMAKRRWRRNVDAHIVICGFGATGSAAALDLINRGTPPNEIVAVDQNPDRVQIAIDKGLVAVLGDATMSSVLASAGVASARSVIVAPNRDDTAVLITLTVREMNSTAHIVAAGREQENLHLLHQGGADEVIDATASLGRMLGMGTHSVMLGRVFEDLLGPGEGIELSEIGPIRGDGPNTWEAPSGAMVVSIVRDGARLPTADVHKATLRSTDRLIVIRDVPAAPS